MPRPHHRQRGYGCAHQAASRRLRAEHVARFGWWCPGFDWFPCHPSRDLVADHLTPGVSSVGYQVLCRACNSRRALASR